MPVPLVSESVPHKSVVDAEHIQLCFLKEAFFESRTSKHDCCQTTFRLSAS